MAIASVTVRGTPEAPIFDFTIPQGEKGEPGGWAAAVDLGSMDLNTVKLPGLYKQSNAITAGTVGLNYPLSVSCAVEVFSAQASTDVIQRLTCYGGGNSSSGKTVFVRRYNTSGDTWTLWSSYSSTRIDQTAGRAIYQWDHLNNREQITYGDTGWRNVATELLNGFTGNVYIRRVHNTVFFEGLPLPPDPMVTGDFYQVPTAFQWTSFQNVRVQGRMANSVDAFWLARKAPTAPITLENVNGSWVAGRGGFAFTTSWATTAAWPTTLPGVAAGTIPNL